MRQLTEGVGVNRRTVMHWHVWWREGFPASAFWQIARAAFMPPVGQDRLPAALIERFRGKGAEQMNRVTAVHRPRDGRQGARSNGRPPPAQVLLAATPRSIYGLHSLDPQEWRA
jgi:hypothetical protein